MHRPAKVGNFEMTVHANQDVLRLDVSVDDVFAVAVTDGFNHLLHIPSCPPFGEARVLLEKGVELSAGSDLQHEIDAVLVPKVIVQAENVRMPEMALNLNLSPELVLHPVPDELLFVEDLQSEDGAAAPFAGQIDGAKLAGTETAAHINIVTLRGRAGWT